MLWHWTWSDLMAHLVTVPARHGQRVVNFVRYPVFAIKLAIWAAALTL
ncbi:hypothetical protein AADZ90_022200 [Aestuariibius sp. 2305UL40-4]